MSQYMNGFAVTFSALAAKSMVGGGGGGGGRSEHPAAASTSTATRAGLRTR
jgi:hypothetical protein